MKPDHNASLNGPTEPAPLNRRQRRARGHRGPLVPTIVTRSVARQLGLTPQQVTTGILQEERNPTPEETT